MAWRCDEHAEFCLGETPGIAPFSRVSTVLREYFPQTTVGFEVVCPAPARCGSAGHEVVSLKNLGFPARALTLPALNFLRALLFWMRANDGQAPEGTAYQVKAATTPATPTRMPTPINKALHPHMRFLAAIAPAQPKGAAFAENARDGSEFAESLARKIHDWSAHFVLQLCAQHPMDTRFKRKLKLVVPSRKRAA